ncbi:hypothetical protein SAMN02745165_00595 [Malonomonas rubra DSM 5091]|uniref:Uncharacterized protein n=1 Tax=Malonomonas rubra DSM 5091 TaxID=1122189 RepID=A0A1M6D9N9_MALRU|nr:hypothetical protein [Malonomonas rubra]SHI69879.1 hypothetical protein SAMN02745165_00595 [Malonomonas rubra DSM 5091]
MGFFDRIFASSKGYEPLDEESLAANRIEKIRDQLESLSKQVHKPLEVVPGEEGGYVFIGKPPKNFGIAWIEDNEVHSLKSLADKGAKPEDLKALSNKLREIYEANQDDTRYSAKIGGKDIVVTPSETMKNQVSDVIHKAAH